MTRTGTNLRGKSYSYYSGAGCQQKGKSVCNGRHIPASMLDEIVLSNLKQRPLTPERLASVLELLADRQAAKTDAVDRRLVSLQREVADKNERLGHLYRPIEDGIVEVDDKNIRIIGNKDVLQTVIAGKQTTNGNVRGIVTQITRKAQSSSFETKHRCADPFDAGLRALDDEARRIGPSANCHLDSCALIGSAAPGNRIGRGSSNVKVM
jgi:hypothetical protein